MACWSSRVFRQRLAARKCHVPAGCLRQMARDPGRPSRSLRHLDPVSSTRLAAGGPPDLPRTAGGSREGAYRANRHNNALQPAYLIGENGAANKILVSCLTAGLSPGGGQMPSDVAFLRMATRSSRLLYAQMCIHWLSPPMSEVKTPVSGESLMRPGKCSPQRWAMLGIPPGFST